MKRVVINKNLVYAEAQRLIGPVKASEETVNQLNKLVKIEKIKKHAFILKKGDVCDFFGVVLKGIVQIYHYKGSKLISDYFACEGSGFFDIESYVNNVPSEAYIEALEPTVIAVFNKKEFIDACNGNMEVDQLYRQIMEYTLIMSHQRLDSILNDSAEEKYENLEKRIPGLTARVSAINIASYIGVTQETLCRIKAKIGDALC